jgi:hypothetical protein
VDESLSRLAGKADRLVHLAATLVGTPNPSLVCSQ